MLPHKGIILDTAEAVNEFKQGIESECAVEYYTRNTVNSILNCLNQKSMAEYELREYVAQVEFGEYDAIQEEIGINLRRRNKANFEEADRIAKLGVHIKERIEAMGLYDSEGNLHYHFDEELHEQMPLPISFIVLKRL